MFARQYCFTSNFRISTEISTSYIAYDSFSVPAHFYSIRFYRFQSVSLFTATDGYAALAFPITSVTTSDLGRRSHVKYGAEISTLYPEG
jgi:hypothetical protein